MRVGLFRPLIITSVWLMAASFVVTGIGIGFIGGRFGDGDPDPKRGLVLLGVGLFIATTVAPTVAVVVASRGPVIRVYRQGVEVVVPDPNPRSDARLLSDGLLGRGLRLPRARIPWGSVTGVATGRRGMRPGLVIVTRTRELGGETLVWVAQSTMKTPAPRVAQELAGFARDETSRAALPGWDNGG